MSSSCCSWSFLRLTSATAMRATSAIAPFISSKHDRVISLSNSKRSPCSLHGKLHGSGGVQLASLLYRSALLASAGVPSALALTGENNHTDLLTTVIYSGIAAFFYFIVAPPIIMNWMRMRWFKRNFIEMYLQFMFTFLFFPGLLLWAPFLNFRKFPRDPTMKYPWSTPKDDTPLYKSR